MGTWGEIKVSTYNEIRAEQDNALPVEPWNQWLAWRDSRKILDFGVTQTINYCIYCQM